MRHYRVRMIRTVRSIRFPAAAVAAVVAAVAAAGLLAGCAGGAKGGATAAGSSSSSSSSSSSGSVTGSKLTKGLLPAAAFGSDATVIGLTLEQLRQATSSQLGAAAAGIQVDPPSCAVAVQGSSPNYDKVGDLAAQSAMSPTGATVEALMTRGPAKGAAQKLRGAIAACPKATVTTPRSGTVTLTFAGVDVKKLGSDSAAMQLTTALTKPDGTSVSVPALLGAVEDHDRLLLLITAGKYGAAPDQAAFAALLEKAYSTQARALD
ncbi:MAG: uncharacterized protein JWO98_3405 [Frankiales bacterium]|nr:uncharacterized protein [Frankiales bacterium]